jgi:anti-anti-sigma factor
LSQFAASGIASPRREGIFTQPGDRVHGLRSSVDGVHEVVQHRSLEVAELGSARFVVSATGALDGDAARELKDTLLPLVAAPRSQVIVDLVGAYTVDVAAVGVLTAAAHVARRERGELVVVTRDSRLARLFEETGLGGLARVERTMRDGTSHVARRPT